LGEDRRKLPWLIFLFLASSAMDVMGLSLIGPYISLVINPEIEMNETLEKCILYFGLSSEPQSLLFSLGIFLICGFFLKAVMTIYVNYRILSFSQQQQVRLRCFLMQGYQELPYVDYISRNSSEYINHMQSLSTRFSHKVVLSILKVVSEGSVALAILTMLAWKDPVALTLFTVVVGGTLVLYYFLFRVRLNQYGERYNEAARSMLQGIQEGFDGFKEIRILGKSNNFLKTVREGAEEFARTFTKTQIINMSPRYIVEFLAISFIVMLIIGAQSMGYSHQTLIPTLAVFGIAAMRLVPTGNIITSSFIQLRFNSDTVGRLHADWVVLQQSGQRGETQSNFPKHNTTFRELTVRQVSFTYPNSKTPALDGISLNIHAGESIGLVGSSGCGKTTLVDALLGLLRPQKGQILYNGKAFGESIEEWRRQVAYLPQQIFLIDNTLRRNIALGVEDSKIDDSKVYEALRQARLDELIENLPDGIGTMLGERGVRLSGGQRQRIALARAFYHERDTLVMDESTSALDLETEREIVEEIKRLKGKRTIIVIAHRLSTLQYCDRIYKIQEGKIVKSGSYKDILKEM
jgi:ATP-binding cassette, subfamily B, bacterial PglK